MIITLRQRVGDAYVEAKLLEDGSCSVEVLDHMSNPITGKAREQALDIVLVGINTLRRHIWKNELKR